MARNRWFSEVCRNPFLCYRIYAAMLRFSIYWYNLGLWHIFLNDMKKQTIHLHAIRKMKVKQMSTTAGWRGPNDFNDNLTRSQPAKANNAYHFQQGFKLSSIVSLKSLLQRFISSVLISSVSSNPKNLGSSDKIVCQNIIHHERHLNVCNVLAFMLFW